MKQKRIVKDAPTQDFLSSLKRLRKNAGLTQIELAAKLNLSYGTYTHYECGDVIPSLDRLINLVEFFEYDLSESINHKRHYGGLSIGNEISSEIGKKIICPDEPARKFLSELKQERKKLGLTLSEASSLIGCDFTSLYDYEKQKCCPLLQRFIKLSKLYHYDISESVNYKYFYREINYWKLQRELKKFGLTMSELSSLTGYERSLIIFTLHGDHRGSIGCLHSILEVLKSEQQSERYRKSLLRESQKRDVFMRQGRYVHRRRQNS